MYPGFANRSWKDRSWKDVQNLFWKPANKHVQPAANSLSSLFRQDAAGIHLHSYAPCAFNAICCPVKDVLLWMLHICGLRAFFARSNSRHA